MSIALSESQLAYWHMVFISRTRFLREDEGGDESQLSWNDRLAKKYYSSLYREYAVCDLKHYKSGNVSICYE